MQVKYSIHRPGIGRGEEISTTIDKEDLVIIQASATVTFNGERMEVKQVLCTYTEGRLTSANVRLHAFKG